MSQEGPTGLQFNFNWSGTDKKTGLPTFPQGGIITCNVGQATECMTLEIRDKDGNLVLVNQMDGTSEIYIRLQRYELDLRGKATIEIHAYTPQLGWESAQTDFLIN